MYGPPILKKNVKVRREKQILERKCAELINIFSVMQSESLNNI